MWYNRDMEKQTEINSLAIKELENKLATLKPEERAFIKEWFKNEDEQYLLQNWNMLVSQLPYVMSIAT